MNISTREVESSCKKALSSISLSAEISNLIQYASSGQSSNIEIEFKKILEKSISKCIYQTLNDLD